MYVQPARSLFRIGQVTVERVEEQCGLGFEPEFLFPDWSADALERHRSWMVPQCFHEQENRFVASIHSWLIKTQHHTILIDCCAGNDKERPLTERFHRRNLPYLERLLASGVAPKDVDYVMCTHLHADHCGWNTRLVNGRWVPTFPNAKYVFSRAEHDQWVSASRHEGFMAGVYDDSVLPVMQAGLVQLVEGDWQLGDELIMKPTPGHSPGHASFQLRSGGSHGLFSGDVMHQPIQVYEPEWNSRFCESPDEARESRRWVLEHCAETGATLFPAHFAGSFAGHVYSHSHGFRWQFADSI